MGWPAFENVEEKPALLSSRGKAAEGGIKRMLGKELLPCSMKEGDVAALKFR
jgi:hypothetical protein